MNVCFVKTVKYLILFPIQSANENHQQPIINHLTTTKAPKVKPTRIKLQPPTKKKTPAPFLSENNSQIPPPPSVVRNQMVDDIRTFIENGLNVYVTDPKYVSKLPKCLHCVNEIKTPRRPSLKPPFPRREADSLHLPARPPVFHLPPLMRTFRSTKKVNYFRSNCSLW